MTYPWPYGQGGTYPEDWNYMGGPDQIDPDDIAWQDDGDMYQDHVDGAGAPDD